MSTCSPVEPLVLQKLVDSCTDVVRERVLELINQKVEGEEITLTRQAEPKAQVIDLMSALKASLSEMTEASEEKKAPKKKAAKKETSRKKAAK